MNKYPVWLDCDVGVDDAIAIMALHALEETDLLAISTVSGNVPLSSTFSNAHRMNGLHEDELSGLQGRGPAFDRPAAVCLHVPREKRPRRRGASAAGGCQNAGYARMGRAV